MALLILQEKELVLNEREGGREKKIGALSIQEKFRFEFQKIPRAQWNGKFPLHRYDPSHRAFDYCPYKRGTEERYWDNNFSNGRRISA